MISRFHSSQRHVSNLIVRTCKWHIQATRASNELNVPWVVRRVDNLHTCSNKVLPGGVCHINIDKFIQEKWMYTLNNIRADMQQEYDV